MILTIEFTRPFSEAVGKRLVEVDFNGRTCEELFGYLVNEYPKLKSEFYTDANEVTEYLIVFVNDKPISALDGMETEVRDGDRLLLFFPISGG
jgi:MoaD family protein